MTQQILDAFMRDLQSINNDIRIGGGWLGRASSITGLVRHLRATVGAPAPMTYGDALRLCASPTERRLAKYRPAIQRLVQVWGRGANRAYPDAGTPTTTAAARTLAREQFDILRAHIPIAYRPNFDLLGEHDMNAMGFGLALAPQRYIRRVQIDGNEVDITARSLFLAAGLVPENAASANQGYAQMLGLTPDLLNEMRGRPILDVAGGGALFGAEMNGMFGCPFTTVDLNAEYIPDAMDEAKRRYAASMMYLQMLYQENMMGLTNVDLTYAPYFELCIRQSAGIFAAYTDTPPVTGNAFDLGPTRDRYMPNGYDYVVSTFFFCYLDRQQQTDVIIQMCHVANRKVIVFSGYRHAEGRIDVDWNQINEEFPNANPGANCTERRIVINLR